MQLRIDQQFARLGSDIRSPFLAMNITSPAVELNIEDPQIEIKAPLPQIQIDQSECFADANLRSPSEFTRYYADYSWSKGQQAINDIAAEGDMLAAIDKGITIADVIAMEQQQQSDYDVAAMPRHMPRVDAVTSPVEVKLDQGSVNLNLHQGEVRTDLQWGKVQAYLAQKDYIKISWIPNQVDEVA